MLTLTTAWTFPGISSRHQAPLQLSREVMLEAPTTWRVLLHSIAVHLFAWRIRLHVPDMC